MSTLTFILGGARSGKSRHAQELAAGIAGDHPALYVATGQPSDNEMAARIARHQEDRPAHWRTVEEPLAVSDVLRREADASVILVDCLTLFVTNHLLRHGDAAHCAAEQWDVAGTERAVAELVQTAREVCAPIILVSNEVGLGLVPTTPLGRVFRDVAGRANQHVASGADRVLLMVAGLPLTVKG